MIKLSIISDPVNCMGGKCPTIYKSEDGRVFVQGWRVGEDVRASIAIDGTEDLVEIPAELLASTKL